MDVGTLGSLGILALVLVAGAVLVARRRILLAIGVVGTGAGLWTTYVGPSETIAAAIPLVVIGLAALGWALARHSPDPPTIWNK
ncbi:MAG TPA: hypothetical protein VGK63_06705 [Candidatus Limnocylindrales bacterium]